MPFELRDAWLKTKVQLKAGDKVAQCPKKLKTILIFIKNVSKNMKIYFMKISLLHALEKKLNFLVHVLLTNSPYPAGYFPNSTTFPISVYWLSNSKVTIIFNNTWYIQYTWCDKHRLLLIWRKSTCRTLELIFNECISNGIFSSKLKNGNTLPIH